jgi:colanic acid/amylovoran biosynthesis glycosyltransferase
MRVGYLINQYPAVSHTFIRREILALERAGHEVFRIALRGWTDEQRGAEDRLELGRTHYVLRRGAIPLIGAFLRMMITRPLQLGAALALILRIGRRADRPLIVHLIYLFEACLVAHWSQSAKIDHLHAHFGTNAAEVSMLVRVLGGPTWSFTVHGPEEFDKANFIGLPEKIRRAAFVVAVSSFGRSQLFRYIEHALWKKIKVIHCGLDRDFYANIPDQPTGTERRLICVGRLCEQKGQLLLIEAARQLVERGIEFELVLAGDGEMRSELERLISQYGLQRIVHITGWLSNEQVRDKILAARALVLPSFAEGLPVVLMEAMALRRPVISTFVAGIPELVESNKYGWLVPAGDVEALVAAMQECLEAPPERLAQMGEGARVRIIERHAVDTEAAKLAALFQQAGHLAAPQSQWKVL